MLTCKAVAMAVARDEARTASLRRRLALRVHLVLCRHCRRYAAQLRALAGAVRTLVRQRGDDPEALKRLLARIGAQGSPTGSTASPAGHHGSRSAPRNGSHG